MNTKTYIRPGKIRNSFLTETMNWISANLPAGITVSFRRLKSGITGRSTVKATFECGSFENSKTADVFFSKIECHMYSLARKYDSREWNWADLHFWTFPRHDYAAFRPWLEMNAEVID